MMFWVGSWEGDANASHFKVWWGGITHERHHPFIQLHTPRISTTASDAGNSSKA